MTSDSTLLAENYRRIASEAERLAGHSVKVIAVTKTFAPELIEDAYRAGIRIIGENRIQEALNKQDILSADSSLGKAASELEWHLIGPVQSNKCKLLPGRFTLCHGLGSAKALRKLDAASAGQGLVTAVLLQLNLTDEEQKAGFSRTELDAVLESLGEMKNIRVRGFMTMGPTSRDVEWTAKVFRECASLRDDASRRFGVDLPELSMGMSGDYQAACRAGATMIRIGQVLFGPRPGAA